MGFDLFNEFKTKRGYWAGFVVDDGHVEIDGRFKRAHHISFPIIICQGERINQGNTQPCFDKFQQ